MIRLSVKIQIALIIKSLSEREFIFKLKATIHIISTRPMRTILIPLKEFIKLSLSVLSSNFEFCLLGNIYSFQNLGKRRRELTL